MRTRDKTLYVLAHPEFYEPLDFYKPKEADFFLPVRALIPASWRTSRSGVWFHCSPPSEPDRLQGWKIHLSATFQGAVPLLQKVVPFLATGQTPFKFLVDKQMFLLSNSKNWARGAAGKFVTIYPLSDDHFPFVIERLYELTQEFVGPHILSDKRYRESKVLYYRYGGFRRVEMVDEQGERLPTIQSPGGTAVVDRRLAYYTPPDWVSDPFGEDTVESEPKLTLRDGRYVVERALVAKNSGGVYLARDLHDDGREVIIKEARPYTGWTAAGIDSVGVLKKEYKVLQALNGAGIAPSPIELFQDWEHWFLVEEHIEGITVASHTATFNALLLSTPTTEHLERFYGDFRSIFTSLARAVDTLHQHNIIFGDLSPTNVIVNRDRPGELKFIDFEGAWTFGETSPIVVFTPGFVAAEQFTDHRPQIESDYYSLGAMMLSYLFPINFILGIKPQARFEFLRELCHDLRFPDEVERMISTLMSESPNERPNMRQVVRVLSQQEHLKGDWDCRTSSDTLDVPCLQALVNTSINYILAKADFSRRDRLFPADPKVFRTNPLSLAHGACGVAWAVKQIADRIPSAVESWILNSPRNCELYSPGLYLGLSGVAWALLDLGLADEARLTVESLRRHPLLYDSPSLFQGAAGCGLMDLKFFQQTGDEVHLVRAREAARVVISMAQEDDSGLFWTSQENVYFGLAEGASGIALFLLYLFLVTGDEEYLEAGKRGLDFDLSHGMRTRDGALSWTQHKGVSSPHLPYWRFGSAGVGISLIRYYAALREPKYLSSLESIFIDTDRKYTVFPGYFDGLSGLGQFALDMHRFLGNEKYLKCAHRVAEGIRLFATQKSEGVAFPGNGLLKISCDFATGGAGIALFLHRLLTQSQAPFLIDSLLPVHQCTNAEGD